MFKSLVKKKTRTDILTGAEADEFARLHTAIYNGGDVSTMVGFNHSNFGLLKSVIGDKYYVVELGEVRSFDGLNDFARVERIRPEPVELRLENGQTPQEVCNGYSKFDFPVVSKSGKKDERLYFNYSLYPFKSEEDRKAFEEFEFNIYFADRSLDSIEKITDYFADENFAIATKDAIMENIYETEFEAGYFESRKLVRRAEKKVEQCVQIAKQGTMGGN